MRPITALTGAALALALLAGTTTSAEAAAVAVTGSTKDPAGDHRGKGMIKNARAADADLRKVRVTYNADQSITVTFTLADSHRKRTGPSPTGVQQVVTRQYELDLTVARYGTFVGSTLSYWDPMEGKPVPGAKPNVNQFVYDGGSTGLLQCGAGSVTFLEDKNAVQIRVPASCHNLELAPGEVVYLSASSEVAVKYYKKQLANGVGGGLVGRDDAQLDPITVS